MDRIKFPNKVTLTVLILGFLIVAVVPFLSHRHDPENHLALPLSHEFLSSDVLIDLRTEQTFLFGNKIPKRVVLSGMGMEGRSQGDNGSTWASRLSLVTGGHRLIFIEFPHQFDDRGTVVTEISTMINGTRCQSNSVTDRPRLFRIEVPAGTLRSGDNRVEVRTAIDHPFRPQRLAVFRDPDASFENLDWSPPVRTLGESEGLVVHREGSVILPFVALPGEHAFACDVDIEGLGSEGTATVRWAIERPLARNNDLTEDLPAPAGAVGPRGLPIQVTLDGDGEYALVIDVESLSPGSHVVIGRPSLVVDPPPENRTIAEAEVTEMAGPHPNSSRPDVIMIILDAARVDHFEPFGYNRATTPFLARLAEESLLFSNTYAQAPYTVCSVPTMITGLSFATHGAVGKDHHSLSEFETTLAEHLSETGYQTIGISSTPKHSRATGADQGYDEFHEVWGKVKSLALDPAPLVDQAAACLRTTESNRPLFMMLHLLPPHAPYLAPAEHDIFRSPSPRWSETDQIDFFHSVEMGDTVPSSDEVDELVALYNGNLHWADSAVESIVTAIQETRNWPNTILVLVSDHGEAFMEHGKLQHSSTLYDEMLRVPLILRLPDGAQPEWVDTERLVSLEDLTPTLLGLIGKNPGPRVTGRNLLSRESTSVRNRVIFRTVGNPPNYGMLADRWKAIVHPDGTRELYDLEADPTESHDLSPQQPTRMSMLAMILARELETAPLPIVTSKDPAISEDELEFLNRLGYVE